jgi:recombinational DNA repair protein RecR
MERIRLALDEVVKKEEFRECVECGEPASSDLCRTCEMLREIG